MEAMVMRYQRQFRKIKDEMDKWDGLQNRLLSQFRNASSIINRLQVIRNPKNHGGLKCVEGIGEAVLRKQMDSLETILLSTNKTLEEFRGVVSSIEKIHCDGRQLVRGVSTQQLQQRVGVKPTLADCLGGLERLHEMHNSEYRLKSEVVSKLPQLALKPSASDLAAFQQLLVDQPNIPKEEVQSIYDIIFAEEIC